MNDATDKNRVNQREYTRRQEAEGKSRFTIWLDDDRKRKLKIVSMLTNDSMTDLVIAKLDELFETHKEALKTVLSAEK